ncbi:hypothetical protein D3C81_375580 [compost metagenome]
MTEIVNRQWRKDINMTGITQDTLSTFTIPTGLLFVSVLNSTNNAVELYQEITTMEKANPVYSVIQNSPYYNQTVPLRDTGTDFTLIFRAGGGTEPKILTLIFSTVNLQINGPTYQPGGTSNTAIISDSVGLAKGSQFPSALGSGGGIKTEIINTPSVTVSGGVEVNNDTGNPIPITGSVTATISGTPAVNIGTPTVNIGTIPEVEIKNDSASAIPITTALLPTILDSNRLRVVVKNGTGAEAIPVTDDGAGTAITGAAIPTGGAGKIGWLSAIWKALTDRLPAALSVSGGLKVSSVDAKGAALGAILNGSITTGGSYQEVIPANTARKFLMIQNISDADLWWSFTNVPATGTGFLLKTGESVRFDGSFIPSDAVNIIGATTGKKFTTIWA